MPFSILGIFGFGHGAPCSVRCGKWRRVVDAIRRCALIYSGSAGHFNLGLTSSAAVATLQRYPKLLPRAPDLGVDLFLFLGRPGRPRRQVIMDRFRGSARYGAMWGRASRC
jgi:hypothetical protein